LLPPQFILKKVLDAPSESLVQTGQIISTNNVIASEMKQQRPVESNLLKNPLA